MRLDRVRGGRQKYKRSPEQYQYVQHVFPIVKKPCLDTSTCKSTDDSLLKSSTYETCKQNVTDTLALVDSLLLTTHPGKSVLEPAQCIGFVCFILNKVDMAIR